MITTPSNPACSPAPRALEPLFYQLKDKDNKTLGYLLGTIHLGDQEVAGLSKKILKRVDKCSQIAIERGPEMISEEEEILFSNAADIEENSTLEEINEELASYENTFKGLPEIDRRFAKMRPGKAARALALAILREKLNSLCFQIVQGHGISSENGVENVLIKRSGKEKELIYLETYEARRQFESVRAKPLIFDAQFPSAIVEGTRQIVELWKTGNEEGLVKIQNLDSDEERKVEEARNRNMAAKIDGLLQGKAPRFFAAIGFLHLPGAKGVVQLLRDKGWNVTRVGMSAKIKQSP